MTKLVFCVIIFIISFILSYRYHSILVLVLWIIVIEIVTYGFYRWNPLRYANMGHDLKYSAYCRFVFVIVSLIGWIFGKMFEHENRDEFLV
jgi:hypothetical protein